MSYEKTRIVGIRKITKKSNGEQHHFLQAELLQSFDIYMLKKDLLKW